MFNLMFGYLRRNMPIKDIAIFLTAVTMSLLLGLSAFNYLKKDVTINDNGKQIHISTMDNTVNEVFQHLGISVKDYDFLSTSLDSKLTSKRNSIQIKRAVPVEIYIDGKTRKYMTYMDTVEEVIEDSGIKLKPIDKLEGVTLSQPVKPEMQINIIRVKEELVWEEIPIPFERVEKANHQLNKGVEKTIVEGVDGILKKEYKETYEDGRLVSKEFVSEARVQEPVTKVVEYGTVPTLLSSRGDTVRYTKVLDMTATAYTASYVDTLKKPGDSGFGICYTGMKVREGIIAVDPKVIPLGTKVYISGGPKDYGFAIAGDIGSAIKGNKIDLYYDSMKAVYSWGKRKVKVYILKEQDDARWKETDHVPGSYPKW